MSLLRWFMPAEAPVRQSLAFVAPTIPLPPVRSRQVLYRVLRGALHESEVATALRSGPFQAAIIHENGVVAWQSSDWLQSQRGPHGLVVDDQLRETVRNVAATETPTWTDFTMTGVTHRGMAFPWYDDERDSMCVVVVAATGVAASPTLNADAAVERIRGISEEVQRVWNAAQDAQSGVR